MPKDPLEAEEERIAADADFVTGSSGTAGSATVAASTASTTRSARATALFRLVEGPMAPQEVSDGTSINTGRAHRTLNELRDRGLVEFVVPASASDGPIYELTVQGEKVAFHIERQQNA